MLNKWEQSTNNEKLFKNFYFFIDIFSSSLIITCHLIKLVKRNGIEDDKSSIILFMIDILKEHIYL